MQKFKTIESFMPNSDKIEEVEIFLEKKTKRKQVKKENLKINYSIDKFFGLPNTKITTVTPK